MSSLDGDAHRLAPADVALSDDPAILVEPDHADIAGRLSVPALPVRPTRDIAGVLWGRAVLPDAMSPEDLVGRLLYRDAMMLVIDKPAGIPVHAGPKGGDNLEMFLDGLRFGLPAMPALAHRLDKDTSGCLALGRHRKATARLGELFASGEIDKTYLAVLVGGPPSDEGTIDAPLARKSHDRRSWWMKVADDGLPSVTHWRVLGAGGGVTAVELKPETGRTHQLRVHMAHLGCPIVGDGVYGGDRARGVDRRLHLHARVLTVPLYPKKPAITVEAPPPAHMSALLALAKSA